MPFCGHGVILAEYTEGIKINPLRCKRWSCPECCEKRKSRLRSEAYRGKPNTFITLTVNPEFKDSPAARAEALSHAWRKIRRQACKGWKNKKIPFIAVFEKTEAGEPHLHILARLRWIDQDWLSRRMKEEINAPVADIRRIRSKKEASRYISKYIGKDPERWEGVKRYWRSQDYLVLERKKWVNPNGEAKRRWFECASLSIIIDRYKRLYYRLEEYDFPTHTEWWMVDNMAEILKKTPPNKQRRDRMRQQLSLEFPVGAYDSLIFF